MVDFKQFGANLLYKITETQGKAQFVKPRIGLVLFFVILMAVGIAGFFLSFPIPTIVRYLLIAAGLIGALLSILYRDSIVINFLENKIIVFKGFPWKRVRKSIDFNEVNNVIVEELKLTGKGAENYEPYFKLILELPENLDLTIWISRDKEKIEGLASSLAVLFNTRVVHRQNELPTLESLE